MADAGPIWLAVGCTAGNSAKNNEQRWIADQSLHGMLSSVGASTVHMRSLRGADSLIRLVKRFLRRAHSPTLMIHVREDDGASLANFRHVESRIGCGLFDLVIVDNVVI